MEKNLKDLASCLKKAGEIVDKLNDSQSTDNRSHRTTSNSSLQSAMSSISSTVERARSMVNSSSTSASLGRLNKKERLRAMNQQPSKKAKPVEKTFEFVLVSFEEEEDDGETYLLEDNSIKLRGFVTLDSFMGETQISNTFENAIQLKYPTVLGKDLKFLKANRRKLVKPVMAGEYTFKEIRLMAGQGSIYVKLKDGFGCLLEDPEKVSSPTANDKDVNTNSINLTKPASPQSSHIPDPAQSLLRSGISQAYSDPLDQLVDEIKKTKA